MSDMAANTDLLLLLLLLLGLLRSGSGSTTSSTTGRGSDGTTRRNLRLVDLSLPSMNEDEE